MALVRSKKPIQIATPIHESDELRVSKAVADSKDELKLILDLGNNLIEIRREKEVLKKFPIPVNLRDIHGLKAEILGGKYLVLLINPAMKLIIAPISDLESYKIYELPVRVNSFKFINVNDKIVVHVREGSGPDFCREFLFIIDPRSEYIKMLKLGTKPLVYSSQSGNHIFFQVFDYHSSHRLIYRFDINSNLLTEMPLVNKADVIAKMDDENIVITKSTEITDQLYDARYTRISYQHLSFRKIVGEFFIPTPNNYTIELANQDSDSITLFYDWDSSEPGVQVPKPYKTYKHPNFTFLPLTSEQQADFESFANDDYILPAVLWNVIAQYVNGKPVITSTQADKNAQQQQQATQEAAQVVGEINLQTKVNEFVRRQEAKKPEFLKKMECSHKTFREDHPRGCVVTVDPELYWFIEQAEEAKRSGIDPEMLCSTKKAYKTNECRSNLGAVVILDFSVADETPVLEAKEHEMVYSESEPAEFSLLPSKLYEQKDEYSERLRKLIIIETKIRNMEFVLDGGGVHGMPKSAEKVCAIINTAKFHKPITEGIYNHLCTQIFGVLEHNLNSHAGYSLLLFNAGARDESTAKLYREILTVLGYKIKALKHDDKVTYEIDQPFRGPAP